MNNIIQCVSKTKGLTKGKKYKIISSGPKPGSKWQSTGYNIINDLGKQVWHEQSPMGIIEILPMTGEIIEFIGKPCKGLTQGKYYDLLDKYSSEYYYFMDDNNKFVGMSIRNYLGGAYNFNVVTEIVKRDNKIESILN